MVSGSPSPLRAKIDSQTYVDEPSLVRALIEQANLTNIERGQIAERGAELVRAIRHDTKPGLMEVFLSEYGLSTDEGVALMCLAEALLRVPDEDTIDALIEDKIAPSDWARHLGESTSPLVNASTWGLMLTGRLLTNEAPGPVGHLKAALKRVGEPVIRAAVARAMKEMGRQFVLGESIEKAMARATKTEARGFTYSYDMLGEAARSDADAMRYYRAYSDAIEAIASACNHDSVYENPGISVKLSALHPRFEVAQRERVMAELVPRVQSLALQAKLANMGFMIDAEEQSRTALSIDVFDAVLADPRLHGWDGMGFVVQAYGPRAGALIDHLYDVTQHHNRRITIRLVKGAYWDAEIKHAQVEGLDGFPVFTSKPATDISYIANARKLLGMRDRIYPQFATHNAHSMAAILHMADDTDTFEFQRLHGMGESLHEIVHGHEGTRCRIYAPVGVHRDLLAYLVRRLLENGANSSFVNMVVDEDVPETEVARDPFTAWTNEHRQITKGTELFLPERNNSRGFDLSHAPHLDLIESSRHAFASAEWHAQPLTAAATSHEDPIARFNPTLPTQQVGTVANATAKTVAAAIDAATPWQASAAERAVALNAVADLYERHTGELFALLAREAGKTLPDGVAEVREAVDFLRYYAAQAQQGGDQGEPVGVFACISPWNFPLAIFTGQVAAALAAGNAVLAKPAEQTPLIAWRAIALFHEAGVPLTALQYLPGDGATVGAALTTNPKVGGVAFTGSTETAQIIRRSMAKHLRPGAPLIAETGGLNAMLVDSTALPEQAVAAIIESAFKSAGQRCSALRCLYVQADIADSFLRLLKGAMDELRLGNPWQLATDCGPVIDQDAQQQINAYIADQRSQGRVIHQLSAPQSGWFVPPTLIKVKGIEALEREVFGPVLHIATFESADIDQVIDTINNTGYGLTFGLQTRIDDRVQYFCDRLRVGNTYINRNQVGAIVGSQPFGGEGLSGTGPKAGGPLYLHRFCQQAAAPSNDTAAKMPAKATLATSETLAAALRRYSIETRQSASRLGEQVLPGPTGESNTLYRYRRAPVLCLGPGSENVAAQTQAIESLGGHAVGVEDTLAPEMLTTLGGFSGVLWWGNDDQARAYNEALAQRQGPILPLVTGLPDAPLVTLERHVCIDTTASGGNTALLSGQEG